MTESKLDAWISKEVDLSQRHEELLLRREALLHGTEAYYDAQENRAASFIASFSEAEQRNAELLQDFYVCISDLKRDSTDPGTPKFNTLKHNYWMMVRNIYPVWQDELSEYDRRRAGGRTPSPSAGIIQTGLSPRPPPGSPPHSARTPRRASPVVSPTVSPTGTLAQPADQQIARTISPNGRPPSPGRKATIPKKTPKKGKGGKSSKSSKPKK